MEYAVNAMPKPESFAEALLNSTSEAIIGLDLEGRIQTWNFGAENLLGYVPFDAIGKRIDFLLPKSVRRDFDYLTGQVQRTRKATRYNATLIKSDGKLIDAGALIHAVTAADQQTVIGVGIVLHDMLTQRQYEDALMQSEKKFRSFIDNSNEGIVIVDEEGIVVEWNPGMEAIFDVGFEEVFGRYIWDVRLEYTPSEKKSPELYQQYKRAYDLFQSSGKNFFINQKQTEEICSANGKIRTIQIGAFSIRTSRGMLLGAIISDITDKQLAENQLKASHQLYKHTVDNISDYIYVVDADLKVILTNKPFRDILYKLGVKQLPDGRTLEEIYSTVNQKERYEFERVFSGGGTIISEMRELVGGDPVITRTKKIPIYNDEGTVDRVLVTISDITVQKMANYAINEQEERFRNFFDSVFDAAFIIERETGKMIEANEVAHRLYGYSFEEFKEINVSELIDLGDKSTDKRALHVNYSPTKLHKRKDGSVFPVEMNSAQFTMGDKKLAVVVVRDLSQSQKAKDALEREQKMFVGGPVVLFKRQPNDKSTVEYVSPNVKQFGYHQNDFESRKLGFYDIIHPEDRAKTIAFVTEQTKKGSKQFEQTYRVLTAYGQSRWVYDFTIVIRNVSSVVTHYDGYIFDVQDRKLAEEQLVKSEERFSQMFYRHNALMYLADPVSLNIIDANPAAIKFFGYPAEILPKMRLSDINTAPEKKIRELLHRITSGRQTTYKAEYRLSDGAIRHVDVRSALIYSKENKPIVFSIIQDITERTIAENALHHLNQQLLAVFEALPGAVAVVDINGIILRISPALETIYGVAHGYANNKHFTKVTRDRFLSFKPFRHLDTVISNGATVSHITPMDEALELGATYKVIASPVKNETGRVIGVIEMLFDVSDLEKTKNDLLKSEALFRSILDNSEDSYILIDQMYSIVAFNQKAAQNALKFCGIKMEESKDIFNFLPADSRDRFVHRFSKAWQGEILKYEQTVTRTPNQKVWLEIIFLPIYTREGAISGVCLIERDINQRKENEEAIRVANQNLKSAIKAKNKFLGMISHEIRTPLSGILGLSQLVLDNQSIDSNTRINIERIASSSQHLLDIINDLLDIRQIEGHNFSLNKSNFSLREALSASVDGLSALATLKGMGLELIIDPQADVDYYGDATRVRQIVYNLAGNSLKHNNKGSCIISVKKSQKLLTNPKLVNLEFVIEDSGDGISTAQLEQIKRKLTEPDAFIEANVEGHGLGLLISQKLVQLLNGKLKMESAPNVGTRFSFDIELEIPNNENKTETTNQVLFDKSELPLRILFAEDDAVNQIVTRALIEKAGHYCETVTDGNELLIRLNEQSYDAIILDIQMPHINGLEATRIIRNDITGKFNPDIPIIATTAYVMPDERKKLLENGMTYVLSKPIQFDELDMILARLAGFRNPNLPVDLTLEPLIAKMGPEVKRIKVMFNSFLTQVEDLIQKIANHDSPPEQLITQIELLAENATTLGALKLSFALKNIFLPRIQANLSPTSDEMIKMNELINFVKAEIKNLK